MDFWDKLLLIREALKLPDGSKLKAGTYKTPSNWLVTTPDVASIFETCRAGFAPAPCETFSRKYGT
jgi:hypothetical protein